MEKSKGSQLKALKEIIKTAVREVLAEEQFKSLTERLQPPYPQYPTYPQYPIPAYPNYPVMYGTGQPPVQQQPTQSHLREGARRNFESMNQNVFGQEPDFEFQPPSPQQRFVPESLQDNPYLAFITPEIPK